MNRDAVLALLSRRSVGSELLRAVLAVKEVAGQSNVVLHAVGLLIALPTILEDGEVVESVSLGAGNTGRDHDLETNRRIAEFKFIAWKGGPESIRQNVLFADLVRLVLANTNKRRQLYVIGTDHPLKFLRGRRSLTSVFGRDVRMATMFANAYGSRYRTVGEFYNVFEGEVEVLDVRPLVPEMANLPSLEVIEESPINSQ